MHSDDGSEAVADEEDLLLAFFPSRVLERCDEIFQVVDIARDG